MGTTSSTKLGQIMELSSEDHLRLNVLLATDIDAIRIDESRMIVYGLSTKGEAKVPLNPNCRDEQYLRRVREMLSGHILNSPGGYPVYLKRWTRMGQIRGEQSLTQLLLLGEPEAIVAVVHSPDLTPELARRAWWAMPIADNARKMLCCTAIINSDMGKALANYLIEHIAFEENAEVIIETVKLILQADLIHSEQADKLWDKGRKLIYRVGFLLTRPDALPNQHIPHPDYIKVNNLLAPLCEQQNRYALQYCKLLSAPGQTFLHTCRQLFEKPTNQEMVVAILEAFEQYFSALTLDITEPRREVQQIHEDIEQMIHNPPPELKQCLQTIPELQPHFQAMLFLAMLREAIILPIFSRTTAMGSLMRKKLLPVSTPILEKINVLTQVGI